MTYADALPLAKGALVGRVISTRGGHYGIVFVSAIHVEHAWGRRVGVIYRGSMTDGWCADEILPRAGAHMVVLLGVSVQPGAPALDLFYTIGRTVTVTQAAQIGDTLPATATAAPSVLGRHNEPPLGLPVVGGGLSFVASWRFCRGGSPLRPAPRQAATDASAPAQLAARWAAIVDLRVGPAHYEVRAFDNGGSAGRVYGYGIVRARLVGMLPETVCYILAITVPPGGVITDADARAIAESFRFR